MTRPAAYARMGSFIRARRDDLGLTQGDLAEAVRISQGYLAHIERGTRRPSPEILRLMARELSIDYAELAGRAGYADQGDRGSQPAELEVQEFARLPRAVQRYLLHVVRGLKALQPEIRFEASEPGDVEQMPDRGDGHEEGPGDDAETDQGGD